MTIKLKHGRACVCRMPGQGWYLLSLYVDEEYRNKGIGTRIMKKVVQQCGRPVYLMTSCEFGGNTVMLKEFYSRFGFVEYKQKRDDVLPYNANMVLM